MFKEGIMVVDGSGRRAFMKTFAKEKAKPFIQKLTRTISDEGKIVSEVGEVGSEERVRTIYPKLLRDLKLEFNRRTRLTNDEVASLLNVLAHDLLPDAYMCKVKRLGR